MKSIKIILAVFVAVVCALIFLFLREGLPKSTSSNNLFQIWTATSTRNIPTPTPASLDWTLIASGDINFSRTVDARIEKFGGSWPLNELASTIKGADYSIVNLESPFYSKGSPTLSGSLILRGNPKGIDSLVNAGIDLVSLANNHATDMGEAGIIETKQLLDQNKVGYLGAGQTEEEAYLPKQMTIKNLKVGFVAFSYGTNLDKKGVEVALNDKEKAVSIITGLKKENDLVIAICHCGGEYQPKPNASQKEFAHTLVDAGANVYIGHHPHIPQPIEVYNNALIAYSLGNLVFDQEPIENRDRSALLKINFFGKTIKSYELIPYQIYNKGQPKLVTNQNTKKQIWQLFGITSETGIVNF